MGDGPACPASAGPGAPDGTTRDDRRRWRLTQRAPLCRHALGTVSVPPCSPRRDTTWRHRRAEIEGLAKRPLRRSPVTPTNGRKLLICSAADVLSQPHRLTVPAFTEHRCCTATQRRFRGLLRCNMRRYSVTPWSENSAGLEAVPGPAGPERGLAPCRHCVFNFKNIAFEEGPVLVPSA